MQDDVPPEFLVKWRSLPYLSCTWESCRTLLSDQQVGDTNEVAISARFGHRRDAPSLGTAPRHRRRA